jgi:hypothetical protein
MNKEALTWKDLKMAPVVAATAVSLSGNMAKQLPVKIEKSIPSIINVIGKGHLKKLTGQYPKYPLEQVASTASNMGLDPKLHVAQAIVEGANRDQGNPVRFLIGRPPIKLPDNYSKLSPTEKQKLHINLSLQHFKNLKIKNPKASEEELLQMYNGRGLLPTKQYIHSYQPYLPAGYAKKNRYINMGKFLPYGKKVMDVKRSIVDTTPELRALK